MISLTGPIIVACQWNTGGGEIEILTFGCKFLTQNATNLQIKSYKTVMLFLFHSLTVISNWSSRTLSRWVPLQVWEFLKVRKSHNETTLKTLQGYHMHFKLGLQIEELGYFDIYLNTWRDKYSDTVRVKHPLSNWWITNGWLQLILRNLELCKPHNPLWNFTGIIININVWLYAKLASLTLLGIQLSIVDTAISLFSGSCLLYSYDPWLITCNGGFRADDSINILVISPI